MISLSPVVAGFLISALGWTMIDPLISLLIGVAIILGALGILKEANGVMLKRTPISIETEQVVAVLQSMSDVRNVHDLHIWSEGSGLYLLTCQLLVEDMKISEGDRLLREIRKRLFEDFKISHATIQLETASCHPLVLYCNLQRRLTHWGQPVMDRA